MKARSGYVMRVVGEGSVLIPTGERVVDMNGLVVLNDTGKFIWQCLASETTPEQIAQAMVEAFDVSLEQARTDVESFVAELDRLGMLERHHASH